MMSNFFKNEQNWSSKKQLNFFLDNLNCHRFESSFLTLSHNFNIELNLLLAFNCKKRIHFMRFKSFIYDKTNCITHVKDEKKYHIFHHLNEKNSHNFILCIKLYSIKTNSMRNISNKNGLINQFATSIE